MLYHILRTLFLTFVTLFFAAGSAHAKWVEARSNNFVFVADTSEKKAKRIVEELEEYRAMIFKLYGNDSVAEILPVRIYGARSDRQIKDMTGWEGSAGVYQTTREGPVFIMNIKGGFSRTSQARSVAYHEYTHHIISTYTNKIYPRWFNEGFAEYLSTFEFNNKKGIAKVGLANDQRAMWLNSPNWIPMDVILKSVRRYPFSSRGTSKGERNTRALFYAQSWLAAHHMTSDKAYNAKLLKYFAALNEFDVPEDAFEQAFGMTPDAYEDVLQKYFKKNRYQYSVIDMGAYSAPAVMTRPLSDAEASFHRAEAIRLFRRNTDGRALAQNYYDKALTAKGASPDLAAQVMASKALILSLRHKSTEALTMLQPTLDALSEDKTEANSRILAIAGVIYFNRHSDDDRGDDDMIQARKYLKRAIKAHPNNISAHYYYAASYPATMDKISKQALYSAAEASLYFRDLQFTESNMPLADILIRENKSARAVPMLERARVWSTNAGVRSYATQSLRRLGKLPAPVTP